VKSSHKCSLQTPTCLINVPPKPANSERPIRRVPNAGQILRRFRIEIDQWQQLGHAEAGTRSRARERASTVMSHRHDSCDVCDSKIPNQNARIIYQSGVVLRAFETTNERNFPAFGRLASSPLASRQRREAYLAKSPSKKRIKITARSWVGGWAFPQANRTIKSENIMICYVMRSMQTMRHQPLQLDVIGPQHTTISSVFVFFF